MIPPPFHPDSGRKFAHLSAPPEHGVNQWCLSAARKCALADYTEAQALSAIMGFAGQIRPGRTLRLHEVNRAIATA
jgi:hypothetical protein